MGKERSAIMRVGYAKGVFAIAVELNLRIWDVEHGACAMLFPSINGMPGRLAMIDAGHAADFRPSQFIRHEMRRTELDYLFITNADQDHISDLTGLWREGVNVRVLHRNPQPTAEDLRRIKLQQGPLTDEAARFLGMHSTYNSLVQFPFNGSMGGITATTFYNSYPRFTDTNNLSQVVFVKFGAFKILFPGDVERAGWLALLENPSFRIELMGTSVLVASHHGRESGFCREIFDWFNPDVVVMSDKGIVHDTQRMVPTYKACAKEQGVFVANTGERRWVLTTRNDGHVTIWANSDGQYRIETENAG